MWERLLKLNKRYLDISSVQLNGSHTPAKRGGAEVAYQNRKKCKKCKKCKTTNALFLTNRQDLPLCVSKPMAGNHNDLFEIENVFNKMLSDLKGSEIETDGLFLNADAGFDCEGFRNICFTNRIIANIDFNKRNSKDNDHQPILDEELYKKRFSVEWTNAWIDAFKALLVRFETLKETWTGMHYIVFAIILLRFKTNHF